MPCITHAGTCKDAASRLAVGMPSSFEPRPKPFTTLPFSLQTGSRGTTPLIMSSKAGSPYCSGLKSSKEGSTEQHPACTVLWPCLCKVSRCTRGNKQIQSQCCLCQLNMLRLMSALHGMSALKIVLISSWCESSFWLGAKSTVKQTQQEGDRVH